MERDSLEKFITANRESFDQGIPSLKVWAEIDQELSHRRGRRVSIWRSLRIAAAVLLLLMSGAVAGHLITSSGTSETAIAIQEIAPEYAELAQFYQEQIDDKVQQLVTYRQSDVVLEDFAQLDKSIAELKQDLLRAPKGTEEQIVENLIRSYQTKVQILERVLERIQSTHQQQTLNPEDDEISI